MPRETRSIQSEIEQLSVERQRVWFGGQVTARVSAITASLRDLYEEKRGSLAHGRHGSRDRITRQAKVEGELERLYG